MSTAERTERIRVMIVDDQPLIRAGLRTMVSYEDDLEVVAEAGEGGTALQAIRVHRPDVVLMDIRMPGMNGLEALRAITSDMQLSAVRVVILTTFDLDEYIAQALEAGASGFVLKDSEADEVVRAVRVVAAGDALLAPAITRRVLRQFVRRPAPTLETRTELARLTEREREVVVLAAYGLSNEQLAARLSISPATARTHISRSMTKLHARDRAQLVVIAYRSGLVSATDLG